MTSDVHVEELLSNAAWVRRLARHLVGDHSTADDVVQDTWLAALERAPRGARLRPWLARVARNFALQHRRSDAARSAREQAAARPEPPATPDQTVARVELHARLVQAVLALEEPYRTTILWRYFDELPGEEIARRAGIDAATVRSRMVRARERLLQRLRADGQDPTRWLMALVGSPVAVTKAHSVATLAWVALALVAACGVWLWQGLPGTDPSAAAAGLGALEHGAASPAPLRPDAPPAARDGRTLRAAGPEAESLPAGSPLVQGVVLNEDGMTPLPDARVAHRRGHELDDAQEPEAERTSWLTATDAPGRFEVARPATAGTGLWIAHEGYFPQKLDLADLPRDTTAPMTVVLAPMGELEVEVLDAAGQPLAGAVVTLHIELSRGASDQRWRHRCTRWGGRTDDQGRLTIPSLPCGMPIYLRTGGAAEPRRREATAWATLPVRERRGRAVLRLGAAAAVTGRLLGADRRPVAEQILDWHELMAGVSEPVRTRTDDAGRFHFAGLPATSGELCVDLPGFLPRVLTLRGGETCDVGDLVLPELLAVSGRLVSRFGTPDGVHVRLYRNGVELVELDPKDGAFATELTPGTVELLVTRGAVHWAGAGPARGEILACRELTPPATGLAVDVDAGRGGIAVRLPPEAARTTASVSVWTSTEKPVACCHAERQPDPQGRLVIGPVAPGRYRLRVALGEAPVAFSAEVTVTAGSIAEAGVLEFAPGAVAGVIVDAEGRPVPGAVVRLHGNAASRQTESDGEGRFTIDAVTPGPWTVDARQGDLGFATGQVAVLARQTTETRLELAGLVTLAGCVRSGEAPQPGVTVFLQPLRSNEVWNATTDSEGRFRLERLPSGRLRLWINRQLMQVLDLPPGANRALELFLPRARRVRFTRNGQPLAAVHSVTALPLDRAALSAGCWSLGHVVGDEAELPAPEGPLLVVVGARASGAEAVYAVAVDRLRDTIEFSGHTLRVQPATAWRGVLPVATLVGVHGTQVSSCWGSPVVLATETGADGSLLLPCVPAGASVRLRGVLPDGRMVDRVTQIGPSETVVRWPD